MTMFIIGNDLDGQKLKSGIRLFTFHIAQVPLGKEFSPCYG